MSTAKVDVQIGAIRFTAEASEAWITAELENFWKQAPALAKTAPVRVGNGGSDSGGAEGGGKGKTLAAVLGEAQAKENQNKRFLATAVWLHDNKQMNRVTTALISKTLRENNQKRLGNPSDCLGQNVSRGYCEKDGKEFYVTEEGRKTLGLG